MKMRNMITAAAAALAFATAPAAFAQDAAEAPAGGDAEAGAMAGEAAPPASAAQTFTDADIANFAKVIGQIQKIRDDVTLDEQAKQSQMASAVQAAGMDVQTFNAIATQFQTDPALKQRIQEEMAAQQATP